MRRLYAKKGLVFLCFSFLVLLGTLLFLFFAEKRSYGHICVYVVDAYSLHPISGAVVVLPESGMQAETDAYGRAEFRNIPIEKNSAHEKLYPQSYGQTSILCFCEGYQPYALFYAQVLPARMREGPSLYMFPAGTQAGCVIEAPPESWIRALLELYDPFASKE